MLLECDSEDRQDDHNQGNQDVSVIVDDLLNVKIDGFLVICSVIDIGSHIVCNWTRNLGYSRRIGDGDLQLVSSVGGGVGNTGNCGFPGASISEVPKIGVVIRW